MASLIGWLKFAGARTSTGAVVASGTATFYVPGTTTAASVWTDSAGETPLANPVSLDASGRAEVWTDDPCDVVIKDSGGVTVSFVASDTFGAQSSSAKTVEVVSDYFTGQHGVDYDVGLPIGLATVIDRIGASIGVDGQFKESSTTGVVARDVHDVLAGMCITPYDFGANGGGTADDTLPVQRAINRASTLGVPCYLGSGIYRITAGLTIGSECHIIGAGKGKSVIRSTSDAFSIITVACAAGRRTGERFAWSMRDFSIEAPYGADAANTGILVNTDTVSLVGGGATIDRVDVAAGNGIDASLAANVRITNCNIISQQGTSESVGIDVGSYGTVENCIVDGVAFSASHVPTGIKLRAYSSASKCLVKNCTYGIIANTSATAAIARNCKMESCGTSAYVRSNFSGFESCESSSPTVVDFKVDSGLTSIVDSKNTWSNRLRTVTVTNQATSTSYVELTDLTTNLVANVRYEIDFAVEFTAGGSEGIKFSLKGAGTATAATSTVMPVMAITHTGTAVGTITILQTNINEMTIAGPDSGVFSGRIVLFCSGGGTLVPRFSQASAGATAATITAGSWVMARVL